MSQNAIKVTYSAQHLTVSLVVPAERSGLAWPETPDSYIEKALSKMQALKASGEILGYKVYKSRILKFWQQAVPAHLEGKEIRLTIAQGVPRLCGIELDYDEGQIAIDPSAQTKDCWSPSAPAVAAYISHKLGKRQDKMKVSVAAVDHMLKKLRAGKQLYSYPLDKLKAKAAQLKQRRYPGQGLLNIALEDQAQKAVITGWQQSYYESFDTTKAKAWLQKELNRLGILAQSKPFIAGALERIARKADLNGLTIARGQPGRAGEAPYLECLVPAALEPSPRQMDLQVEVGQAVARIAYQQPGEVRTDVFGKPTEEQPEGPEPKLQVMTGVERRGLSFYAIIQGVLGYTETSIGVKPQMVIAGDLKSTMGAVCFEGSVVVQGSIQPGVMLDIGGNLEVEASISGGMIKVGGNIRVQEGIITGEGGLVMTDGSLQAKYIENSYLMIKGHLKVERAILNSRVLVDGKIKISDRQGLLAGGVVRCAQILRSPNIGFPNSPTRIEMGLDWKQQKKISIREARKERLELVLAGTKTSLEALKKQPHLSAKRKDQLKELKTKLVKLEALVKQLSILIKNLQKTATYNEGCQILVKSVLKPTSVIEVAGEKVPVSQELKSVRIMGQARLKNRILPFHGAVEEEDEEDEIEASA